VADVAGAALTAAYWGKLVTGRIRWLMRYGLAFGSRGGSQIHSHQPNWAKLVVRDEVKLVHPRAGSPGYTLKVSGGCPPIF
jgi:hypothetical protein